MDKELRKKRVFFGLVNYGTQSGILAAGLRTMKMEAISVTGPDSFKRLTDITLVVKGRGINKLINRIHNLFYKIFCFFHYDIFHFFYGTSLLPYQLDLPLYRFFGKKVIMEHLGNDIQLYQKSIDQYKWTNVQHMMTREQGALADIRILERHEFEKKYLDLSLVCMPCYSEFAPGSKILPLAINLNAIEFRLLPKKDVKILNIMHAPTDKGFKGTKFIVDAINTLKKEGYPIKFTQVEGVTHEDLMKEYEKCHIFIDQILGGWYGTASIEAMAVGRPVVCFIRKNYFNYIDYGDDLPLINADPDSILEVLRDTIQLSMAELSDIGYSSRKYVEKYHESSNVVSTLVDFYSKL
jgi:glycosyltransferase involved in cell wall biosynthesis